MSIWVSHQTIGDDDYDSLGGDVRTYAGGWSNHFLGGDVRTYAGGWSNHFPTTTGDVERPASLGLAHIPVWCVPGHEDYDDADDRPLGPWLRLSVHASEAQTWALEGRPVHTPEHATVVLDEDAARLLRDELTAWLDAPKAHPKETT